MNGFSRGRDGSSSKKKFRRLFVGAAFAWGFAFLPAAQGMSQSVQGLTGKVHPPTSGTKCGDCHQQVLSFKTLHTPVKENKCDLCHTVPPAGGVATLTVASQQLCLRCHSKEKFKGTFEHGPYAVGACMTCHEPHGGEDQALLRTSGQQVCLPCHTDMEARFANARFQHRATVTGCTGCHSPHASDTQYELRTAMPDLCKNCHEPIFADNQKAQVKHQPVVDGLACRNCHDPHMAEDERLLVGNGIDVCLKCHDKSVKVDKYELAHMKQLLDSNPEHHGPIQGKECSGCHKPHGSAYFRLLTNEYPKEFYAPFRESNYDLCFRCHESTLVKEERTTTLTEFRDGNRNLHFVHVNKTPKGRTCRSCHETHASTLPNHIRVSVPFGTWDLPVGFKKSVNGGSCESGCHAVQKYDRRVVQVRQP